MSATTATAMDGIEIGEFLAGQRTGVLALADRKGVYAFPVSFAFQEDESNFYFRLGYGEHSQKCSYVEGSPEASLVVYDRTAVGWKSVIAEGQPETVSKLDTNIAEAVNQLQIPFFQVHRQPAAELEFNIVRLDVDKLSGIVEAQGSPQKAGDSRDRES